MTAGRCLVTAHAGCLGTVPNSMANIQAALASEADLVEVDLRATRDGVVVLAHDDSLETGGGRARIGDLDWEELRKLPHPGGEWLRLETVLDLAAGRDRVLNLDAKELAAMILASRLLRSRGMATDAVFSGLDSVGIRVARENLPGFRYLFNADAEVGEGGEGEGGEGTAGIAAVCALASASGACGVNLPWTRISASLVDYARRRCLPVLAWTVDDGADMAKALGTGVYSITTHRPDILAELIRSGFQGE